MASSAQHRAKTRRRSTVKLAGPTLEEIAPRSAGAGTIAAYLADMRAIEEHCESRGLPYSISKPLKDRLKEECERRHFPGPDPRAGGVLDESGARSGVLDTEARLWRWIERRLEHWRNTYLPPWRDYITYPYYRDLVEAYGHMGPLKVPGVPARPYQQMSERECRDELQAIANMLERLELESPRSPTAATVEPTTDGDLESPKHPRGIPPDSPQHGGKRRRRNEDRDRWLYGLYPSTPTADLLIEGRREHPEWEWDITPRPFSTRSLLMRSVMI